MANEEGNRGAKYAAGLSAIAAIAVALIQFGPTWLHGKRDADKTEKPQEVPGIGGRVVDADTNVPIAGADISVAGGISAYITENNGNFRFTIADPATNHRIRLRIDKKGYQAWDRSVGVPSENLIVQLQRERK